MIDRKSDLKNNDRFCFFQIESGDENIMKNQLSNANIQDISLYNEKEIIHFPFSCFEIISIKQKNMSDFLNYEIVKNDEEMRKKIESILSSQYMNENYYEIKLNYLGKYSEEIEKIKDVKIPLTTFAENIFTTELFNKQELKDSEKFAFDISKFIKGAFHNYIIGYYNILNDDANKDVFIINGTNKNIDKIKNCEIKLSNKIIEFKTQHKFKKGKYTITFYFKDYLTNLNDLKTENVTDMSHLFHKCSSLKKLNLSDFNTQKVTNMNHMFSDCSSLIELNLSNFNTINVKNMNGMFFKCSSLTKLNLSSFNTKNVTTMSWMFASCSSLKNLKISHFKTNNVTDMSYMFYECSSLTKLDLSQFSTINVLDMSSMFNGCNQMISLNISSFNTDKTKYFHEIFNKLNPSCKVECKNKLLMNKI